MNPHDHRLVLEDHAPRPGPRIPIAFSVVDEHTRQVTDYEVLHERLLHLIAVRHDLEGFQHVHPQLDDQGRWTTELDLTPGPWRLFADIRPSGGEPTTLHADLTVPGDHEPRPPQEPRRVSDLGSHTVHATGDLVPGEHSQVTMTISQDGAPVTDLDPYLGAYGHLVAIREGDLTYLHVHPDAEPQDPGATAGPDVTFHAGVTTPGTYHLFLDFQHGGVVRTASFVLTADG